MRHQSEIEPRVTHVARPEIDAYGTVRADILAGHLSPNERLVEQDPAERYGLTRAAIRMALARLEQDGVVVRERHRGARVRLVSVAEAVEILETRAALEGLAARHAALNATDEDVAALRRLVAEMTERHDNGDLLGMSACNGRLHGLIVELSRHGTRHNREAAERAMRAHLLNVARALREREEADAARRGSVSRERSIGDAAVH